MMAVCLFGPSFRLISSVACKHTDALLHGATAGQTCVVLAIEVQVLHYPMRSSTESLVELACKGLGVDVQSQHDFMLSSIESEMKHACVAMAMEVQKQHYLVLSSMP